MFFEKNFLLNDLDLLFSAKKKFCGFFFRKYLQKLLIIFTYYQKFSDWQKITENFQYSNLYIFVKLNLFRSLFTIFYIYIVIFSLCAEFRRTVAHFFFISLILFYFIFLFSKTKIEIDYQN